MDSDPLSWTINLVAVLLLVLLNGFFVAAEFALVKVRGSRIDTLAEEGNFKAKIARRILSNLNAYLSACQLGITLASLALGWIGEPAVADLLEFVLGTWVPDFILHTLSFIIAFSIITAFHITIGEQVPKTYAIRNAEPVTLWCAPPLLLFYRIMYPFIWALNGSSNWMLRRAGVEPEGEHESVHTEEEIRVLMQQSHQSGLIDKTEMTLMDNIFEFAETNAREIMIPRTEMICLYADDSLEENKRIVMGEKHTRYPVCDPDKDNVIGYVHIRDLMENDTKKSLKQLVRPLLTVPDSIPISTLLKMMQKKRTEMALLIDEYGGTSGIVTTEDILEEIVGEIHDEFDEGRPQIEERGESAYSFDGLLLIEEVNDLLGLEIETDDYDTIGGWMYSQVELPPRKQQCVRLEGFEFIVDEVDHMRVSRLSVRKLEDVNEDTLKGVS
ncbi:hemolysin family protein [Paenibacillus turpanensis]|uniref:hemolysin family protein n=1 Tax=Paenibacillus turpanensis TaxID=2689078 RepID=UPI00140A5565|nr:hemolysin family protein [Paenibacillus turpanensis]